MNWWKCRVIHAVVQGLWWRERKGLMPLQYSSSFSVQTTHLRTWLEKRFWSSNKRGDPRFWVSGKLSGSRDAAGQRTVLCVSRWWILQGVAQVKHFAHSRQSLWRWPEFWQGLNTYKDILIFPCRLFWRFKRNISNLKVFQNLSATLLVSIS